MKTLRFFKIILILLLTLGYGETVFAVYLQIDQGHPRTIIKIPDYPIIINEDNISNYINEFILRRGEINTAEIILNLHSNRITPAALRKLLNALKEQGITVYDLELENGHHDDEVIPAITDTVVFQGLRFLNLGYNNITGRGIMALVAALTRDNNLEWLSLTQNPLDEAAFLALMRALPSNRHIHTLMLPRVDLNRQNALEIYAELTARNIDIRSFTYHDCGVPSIVDFTEADYRLLANIHDIYLVRNRLIEQIMPALAHGRANAFWQLRGTNLHFANAHPGQIPPVGTVLPVNAINQIAGYLYHNDDLEAQYRIVMILLHGTRGQREAIMQDLQPEILPIVREVVCIQDIIRNDFFALGVMDRSRIKPDVNGALQLVENLEVLQRQVAVEPVPYGFGDVWWRLLSTNCGIQ